MNDKFLIGIDASINGSCVFILEREIPENFHILIFCQTKKDFNAYLNSENLNIVPVHTVNKKLYLINRAVISSKIIAKFIREVTKNLKCAISIENYAYGAPGRLASIGEFIGILKYELLMDGHFIKSPTPGTVKKFAGKGNANKEKMKEFFCQSKFSHQFPETLIKLKSFSDIVDAYFICQLLKYEFDCKIKNEIPEDYKDLFNSCFYAKMDYISSTIW